MRAVVTRWVADEPQPGMVQIEFTDARDKVHRVDEKTSVVDADGRLHAHADYPIETQIACLPQYHGLAMGRIVNFVDLTPWGIDEKHVLYPMVRDQLSWAPPADYSDLSLAARQAVALLAFRRWRESVGLTSGEMTEVENHLWEYPTVTPETFDGWYAASPDLVLGDELPRKVRASIEECGLAPDVVRRAIGVLSEITHGALFGRVDSEHSLRCLRVLEEIIGQQGADLPAPEGFIDSLWIDGGWGQPDEALVGRWRSGR